MKIKNIPFLGALLCALFLAIPLTHAADTATAQVGQELILTATADGTQPFTYQWSKDGVAIAGEISAVLDKTNIQKADAGTYTCLIKNEAGQTVGTLVFTVTVVPPSNGTIKSSVK